MVQHSIITHDQKTEVRTKGAIRNTQKCHREKGQSQTLLEEVECGTDSQVTRIPALTLGLAYLMVR